MISLDRLHSQRLIGAMTLIWVREHHLQLNWSLNSNREHGINDLATERAAVFSSSRWPDYMQIACFPDWQGAALAERMVTFLIAKYAKKCIGKPLLSPGCRATASFWRMPQLCREAELQRQLVTELVRKVSSRKKKLKRKPEHEASLTGRPSDTTLLR